MSDLITAWLSSYDINDITITNVGLQLKNPDHSFGPVARQQWILQYCFGGKGYLVINGVKHTVSEGDVFLIPSGIPAHYFADSSNPYTYYWAGIVGSNAEYILDKCKLTPISPVRKYPEILPLFELLFETTKKNTPKSKLLCLSVLYNILSELSDEEKAREKGSEYIEKALRIISENYAEDLTVESVAKKLNLARGYFSELFSRYMNVTAVEYIINYRISRACKFLKEGKNVTETAILCGFNDPSNFSVRFKKVTGMTPLQYKKLMASDNACR